MTQALTLVTVAHWSQSGELSAQHIRGETSNVLEHTNEDEFLLKIVDRFSFQGNMVINMTGDATHGKCICMGYIPARQDITGRRSRLAGKYLIYTTLRLF